MTPERWKQITETFHAALACDEGQREAFLREISVADGGLSREVESLLAAHHSASHFGSTPINPPSSLLRPGVLVGPYRVERLIGVGGMGQVYRAHDPRVQRDVALKVLSSPFTEEPERLAAVEREARLLASLNHAHIGALYGLEYIDDHRGLRECALVMEFVGGEDLAERVARGPIPVPETLRIARQISEALEAAHEQGVIHCDLKPSNVKVREDGTVKLIDFGVAKVLEHSARSTGPVPTGAGEARPRTFGTAAYTPPERAQGKPADQRTDIWAFGVVLYEMLTGQPLYSGTTPAEILRTVSEHEPDLTALPAALPVSIHTLIGRCLTKDTRYRLQAIGEARIVIEHALAQSQLTRRAVDKPSGRTISRSVSLVIATGAVAATAMLMTWRPWSENTPPAGPVRMSAELGIDANLAIDATAAAPAIVLSPDGELVAFVATEGGSAIPQIYIRRLDQAAATRLPGTDGAHGPFFSPDGQWIGFFADGQLRSISTAGGKTVTIGDAPNGRGGAWGPSDTIVFSPDNRPYTRLLVVRPSGGAPEPLPGPAEREWHQRWPQVLPGGKGVLYTANDAAGFNDADLVVQPLAAGTRKVVHRGGFHGRYVSSGHLLYVHDGALVAVAFDLDRLEVTGQPVRVLDHIISHDGTGGAQFDVSQGTLVYLPGAATSTLLPIHWLGREGPTTVIRATPSSWFNLRFAPNGRRIAMQMCDEPTCDVYVYDWERDDLTQLTRDRSHDGEPVWTPDGGRLTFYSERADGLTANLYWQSVDRPTEAERLTESKHVQLPGSWHPSGRFLAFEERRVRDTGDLMILPIEGDEQSGWKPATPTVFLSTPANEREPMFSPDGRWLAYSSNESGRYEVYVRPFPGPGTRSIVSEGGGSHPTWSRISQELYYGTRTGQIMSASYTAQGDTFRVERARPWAEARYAVRGPNRMFDLHPDGRRFAVAPAQSTSVGRRDHLSFILNFAEELRRLAPAF